MMRHHRSASIARAASLASLAGWALVALSGCFEPRSVTCPSGRVCPVGQQCAASQDICIVNACGNGVRDKGEACDDGNVIDGTPLDNDRCSHDCTTDYSCGNTITDRGFGEACDEGPEVNGTPGKCSADCKSTGECGNGIWDQGEECDFCTEDAVPPDGGGNSSGGSNGSGGDNGSGGSGGQSDGAMSVDALDDLVSIDVGAALDGADDGGTEAGGPGMGGAAGGAAGAAAGTGGAGGAGGVDGGAKMVCTRGITESRVCNFNCTKSVCLDGIRNKAAGEECDDGRESPTCTDKCTLSRCGDAKINHTAGEDCDVTDGPDTRECNGKTAGDVACHTSRCGDGYTNTESGEGCDVAGGLETTACNGRTPMAVAAGVACRVPACGDGYANSALANGVVLEDCDVLGGGDAPNCNGIAAGPTYRCKRPLCGDGYKNVEAQEDCDVAGGADTPGCNGNSALAKSAGVACHVPSCGDGYKNGALLEECDVAGGADTIGCNGNGAGARAAGVACHVPFCGDGYLNTLATEDCDDGNKNPGDGCDANCKVEGTFTCSGIAPTVCKPRCGDGTKTLQEACDDYNSLACGTCSATCQAQQVEKGASGSINAISSSNIADGETFVLNDGIHPPVTFEFDKNGSVVAGRVAVDATSGLSTTMAGRIASAINGVGPALAISAVVETVNPKTHVFLTNVIPGTAGTQPITKNVGNGGFGVANMTGGVGFDCAAGDGCLSNADCASRVCCLPGIGECPCPSGGPACVVHKCLAPTCADGVLNEKETDIDCGGTDAGCARCADNQACIAPSDCANGYCATDGTCKTPTCSDGAFNGNETDADCGGGPLGGAAACPLCANGRKCKAKTDCLSNICATTAGVLVCQVDPCKDGITNGNETDKDCGGGTCAVCQIGDTCKVRGDCATNYCSPGKTCQIDPCADGVQNNDESDKDCGGSCPAKCANNFKCNTGTDCVSGNCPGVDGGGTQRCAP